MKMGNVMENIILVDNWLFDLLVIVSIFKILKYYITHLKKSVSITLGNFSCRHIVC